MLATKLVLLAAAMLGCAPEYAYVPTTSATISGRRLDTYGAPKVLPRLEPITTDASHTSVEPARPALAEQPHHKSEASAYMLLSALLLLPFLAPPQRPLDLSFSAPVVSRGSSLPGVGELPGSVEVLSTISAGPGVAVQHVVLPLPSLFRPAGKAWTP